MFKPPTSTSENIVSHDVCEHLIVSSLDIFNYFGNSKRPIREGTELLNAGWVTTLGIAPVPAKKRVIGLVIQTSSISASPHEVKMDFLTEQVKYWKCVCSCKAGVGEKCKHIAACLLHINRYPTIHGISSTELKQKWGKTGRSIAKNFSSVCTTEMCHVRKEIFMVDDHITEEIQKSVALKFLKVAPNAELPKLLFTNRSLLAIDHSTTDADDDDCNFYRLMIDNDYLKKFIPKMQEFLIANVEQEFQKIAKTVEQSMQICKATISQTDAQWLVERKIRITASIAYNLYTYACNKAPNWDKKLASIYESNFKGNEATRYGLFAEKKAKQIYQRFCLLFECGLIISPHLPYIAVSPDGIVFDGDEWKLLEIKCPMEGKTNCASAVVKKLRYLKFIDSNYILNKNHAYYGQIQLGLAVTNLMICDFIVFSTFDNSFQLIKVARDEDFLVNFIEILTHVYFKQVMPFVLKHE